MKIAVSACLLGENCKYNGKNNYDGRIVRLAEDNELIPLCPETLGGLTTPRTPSERRADRVMTKDGRDVTKEFTIGAERAMETVRRNKPDLIILQPRSPSCGKGRIYDGSFTGVLTDGDGVFAAMAIKEGYRVITADEMTSADAENGGNIRS